MTSDERQTRLEDAQRLLRAMLAEGPKRSRQVKDAATQLGIPLYVLGQARRAIGVRVGEMRGALTTWELPAPAWRDPEQGWEQGQMFSAALDDFWAAVGAWMQERGDDPSDSEQHTAAALSFALEMRWDEDVMVAMEALRTAMEVGRALDDADAILADISDGIPATDD
jgi:hypothetical protein